MLINANKYQSEQTQNLFALGMSGFLSCQLLSILPEVCSSSDISQNVLPLFQNQKASFRNVNSEYIKNVTLNLTAIDIVTSSLMYVVYS